MSEWLIEKYSNQIDELYAENRKLKTEIEDYKSLINSREKFEDLINKFKQDNFPQTYDISKLIPEGFQQPAIPAKSKCVHLYGLEYDWESTNQIFIDVKFGEAFSPKDKEDIDEIFNFCPYCGVKFIHD